MVMRYIRNLVKNRRALLNQPEMGLEAHQEVPRSEKGSIPPQTYGRLYGTREEYIRKGIIRPKRIW